jgi:iron complex transport system permease protein
MNLREVRSLSLAALSALAGLAAALLLGLPIHAMEGGELWRIFFSVRMPEAATAALVGGGLGLSGLLFQLVLRNALADPYVLGVAGGSTFGAVVATLAMGTSAVAAGIPMRAVAAFAGGIITLVCLLRVSRGKASTLILAGVIANTAFAAGARVLTVFFSPSQLAYVTTFLVGFIPTPPRWAPLLLVPPTLYTLGRFISRGRGLDLLLLSDDEASTLGLAVGRVRREALVLATLLASAAVALCGMIGFVGLVVPHVARLAAGNRHRVLVPASFLFGAAFLLLAHAFGKVMAGTWFLPVGVYTSLIGAPTFLFLLVRTARKEWI